VLKRLPGLGAALGPAGELLARMGAVAGCVAPVAGEARAGDLWLAYPFVEGRSPMEAAEGGTEIGAALESAVSELHRAGLVHGSLSEGNVRVTPKGEICLLEAGLAALAAGDVTAAPTADDDRRDLAALVRRITSVVEDRRGTGVPLIRVDEPRRPKLARVAAAGGVLATVAVTGLLTAGRGSAARPTSAAPSSVPPRLPATSVTPCTKVQLPAEPGASVLAVDMSGDGCAEPMEWHDGVIFTTTPTGELLRFAVGRPGDVLVVGHWTCTNLDLPAVYRRGTGEVFYVQGWPDAARRVKSEPAVQTRIRDGTATTTGGRCQRVEVRK
jgi:hypothetical protein